MEPLIVLGVLGAVYGTGIVMVVRRAVRDAQTRGDLSVHDGQLLMLHPPRGRRTMYAVEQSAVMLLEGHFTRVAISGVELSREMGFRLQGKTRATSSGLEGRIVVDGTKQPELARRLFSRDDVNLALRMVCGAKARFKAINLYPDGDLVVDVLDGPTDDLVERLLRFCEVIDEAAGDLTTADVPRLGATSGSASSAAFSIEIRS